jgi:hypothetical protein
VKNRRKSDALQKMTDTELLDAVRRRDVSVTFRLPVFRNSQAGFFVRDEVMRDEAKRRNLL